MAYVDEDAEERRRSLEGEAALQRLDEEEESTRQDAASNGMASVVPSNGDSQAPSGSIETAGSSGAGAVDAEGGRDAADDNLLPPRPSGESEIR